MKTYVIAAQHGEELFGLKIAGKLQQNLLPSIKVRVGHPEAVAKKVRFIDHDLNRSYGNCNSCIESKIAAHIRQEIEEYFPEVIIDLHTSFSNVGNIAIVADINQKTIMLANHFKLDSIVKMPQKITDTSLLGCFPEKSISLEFGKNRRSDKLARRVSNKILEIDQIKSVNYNQLTIYEVFTEIDKNYHGLEGIKNLQYNRDLDGYPFLAGPNTYEAIGGFLARKL